MNEETPKPKKRLNLDQKRSLRAEELRLFYKQTGRKRRTGYDPNDRNYRRSVERVAKYMKPEDLDRFLRDGDEDLD